MNAEKERELFLHSVERYLERENRILGEYCSLSELVEDTPAALLTKRVIAEGEAHRSVLCTIMTNLKRTLKEEKGTSNRADGLRMKEDRILFWTKKLRVDEERFAAGCLYLKNQASRDCGKLLDALFDVMLMDSKKRQRLLLAVKEMVGQATSCPDSRGSQSETKDQENDGERTSGC